MDAVSSFLYSYIGDPTASGLASLMSALGSVELVTLLFSAYKLIRARARLVGGWDWGGLAGGLAGADSRMLPHEASGAFLCACVFGAALYHSFFGLISALGYVGQAPAQFPWGLVVPCATALGSGWLAALAVASFRSRWKAVALAAVGALLGAAAVFLGLYWGRVPSLGSSAGEAMAIATWLSAALVALGVSSLLWHACRAGWESASRKLGYSGFGDAYDGVDCGQGPMLSGLRWLASLALADGSPRAGALVAAAAVEVAALALAAALPGAVLNAPGIVSYVGDHSPGEAYYRYYYNAAQVNVSAERYSGDGDLERVWAYTRGVEGMEHADIYDADNRKVGEREYLTRGDSRNILDLIDDAREKDLDFLEVRHRGESHPFGKLECERDDGGEVARWKYDYLDEGTGDVTKELAYGADKGWAYSWVYNRDDEGNVVEIQSVAQDGSLIKTFVPIRDENGVIVDYKHLDPDGNEISYG